MTDFNWALERFYIQYRQELFTYALAILKCSSRAEDAVHDAFCRLIKRNNNPVELKPYVFRAVRNAAMDELRHNPAPAESNGYIFDCETSPREAADLNETSRKIATALLTLTEDERETVVQHLYTGLTFREIAEIRETPLGTVTSWYQRGLKKLRERLEK